jgi:phage shock protein PspC (stress-responsive transcriptional regulator)
MKKTISISLGGFSFQIEEDAYTKLETYLKEVQTHFSSYPDSSEIVSDMESRIAEHFQSKLQGSNIVTQPLVEELILVMGKTEEFGDTPNTQNSSKKESSQSGFGKKFFRNPEDVIIAGVASGIAAYLGVEPVWVRLVFGLSIFFGGFGILLYIILWVIVPEAKTDTEKMQMRGEPINLKNVESMVKERVEELKKKDSSSFKKIISAPFKIAGVILGGLGNFFSQLFPFIFRIVGVVISIAMSIALAGLIFAGVSLLINPSSPYIGFPLNEIAFGLNYYVLVISAFFVVFVPLIFLMLLGTSLVALKSSFGKMTGFSLLGLWFVALGLFLSLGLKHGPQIENTLKNSAYFKTENKLWDLKDFDRVSLDSNFKVNVHPALEYKVETTGTQSDLDNLKVFVENGTLKTERTLKNKFCIFCRTHKVIFEVYMPTLLAVQGQGASEITIEKGFISESLNVDLSGASKATLDVEVKNLLIKLSGASKLEAFGIASTTELQLSGASKATLNTMEISDAKAKLSGASRVSFGGLNTLQAQLSGASKITYNSVNSIQESTSGASKIEKEFEEPETFHFNEPLREEF